MRISDWSSDVCSSDLSLRARDKEFEALTDDETERIEGMYADNFGAPLRLDCSWPLHPRKLSAEFNPFPPSLVTAIHPIKSISVFHTSYLPSLIRISFSFFFFFFFFLFFFFFFFFFFLFF